MENKEESLFTIYGDVACVELNLCNTGEAYVVYRSGGGNGTELGPRST